MNASGRVSENRQLIRALLQSRPDIVPLAVVEVERKLKPRRKGDFQLGESGRTLQDYELRQLVALVYLHPHGCPHQYGENLLKCEMRSLRVVGDPMPEHPIDEPWILKIREGWEVVAIMAPNGDMSAGGSVID